MEFKNYRTLFFYTRRVLISKGTSIPPKLESMCANAYEQDVVGPFLQRVKAIDESLLNKEKLSQLSQINVWLNE